MRVLIIDDEAVRVPNITAWLEYKTNEPLEVTHSATFRGDFDNFDIVCLDHDLGTGYEDVHTGVRRVFPEGYSGDAQVIIHSMNPVGAENIRNSLGTGICFAYRRMT